MKVKLLKKLHKRFKWRYDKDASGNPWRVYDKEYENEIYPNLPQLGYWYSERTIYALMKLIQVQYIFTTVQERKEKRRIKKLHDEQRREWERF